MTKSLFIRLEEERFSTAWQTACKFIIVGILWIVVSDLIVFFTRELDQPHFPLFHIEVVKGIVFVLVMGAFIYYLVRRTESGADLRSSFLFRDHPIPMWVFAVDSLKILEVNNAAIKRYGYAREEFLSMTLFDLKPDAEIAELKFAMQRIDEGMFYKGRTHHLSKDRTIIPTEISVQPLTYARKRAAIVVCLDFSLVNKLEEQLVTLQKEYEREVDVRLNEILLSNKELSVRFREVNATNDELINVNRMLLDANRNYQQRVACELQVRREQLERWLERNAFASWTWHVQDPDLRYLNKKTKKLFRLADDEVIEDQYFWKSNIDAFDQPLVEIHLAILEKDDTVEFIYKLANEDTLVHQKINVIRNDNELPIIYEFEARVVEKQRSH